MTEAEAFDREKRVAVVMAETDGFDPFELVRVQVPQVNPLALRYQDGPRWELYIRDARRLIAVYDVLMALDGHRKAA